MGNKKTKLDSIKTQKLREKKMKKFHDRMEMERIARVTDPERVEKERQRKIRHYVQMNAKGVKMIGESVQQLQLLGYSGNVSGALTQQIDTEQVKNAEG